jgi:hypothetical protein
MKDYSILADGIVKLEIESSYESSNDTMDLMSKSHSLLIFGVISSIGSIVDPLSGRPLNCSSIVDGCNSLISSMLLRRRSMRRRHLLLKLSKSSTFRDFEFKACL